MLGDRIEREHSQYLRDSQRIEDKSGVAVNGTAPMPSTNLDFHALVGGGHAAAMKPASPESTMSNANGTIARVSWEDDVWGSILGGGEVRGLDCFLASVL